jgi:hypothetical protein
MVQAEDMLAGVLIAERPLLPKLFTKVCDEEIVKVSRIF